MALRGANMLRFSYFPPDVMSKVNAIIQKKWARGISHEEAHAHSCYQVTLLGTAFGLGTETGFVAPRIMISSILETIYEAGYRVWDSAILNGSSRTFDTIFFVKADVVRFSGTSIKSWSVGITSSDTITLVNPPPAVRDWLHGWIPKAWPRGYTFDEDEGRVTDSKPPKDLGTQVVSLAFYLKGKPFEPTGQDEELLATVFVGGLMTGLRGLGWDVLASTNTTNGTCPRNIWYFGNLRECFDFSGKMAKQAHRSAETLVQPQGQVVQPQQVGLLPQGQFVQPQGQVVQPQQVGLLPQGQFVQPQGQVAQPQQGQFVQTQGQAAQPQQGQFVQPQGQVGV